MKQARSPLKTFKTRAKLRSFASSDFKAEKWRRTSFCRLSVKFPQFFTTTGSW
jgi:hypothetical protein